MMRVLLCLDAAVERGGIEGLPQKWGACYLNG